MKTWLLVGMIAIAGCGGSAATCSNMVACGGGSYQACTDGAGCWLAASDGTRFSCNGCGDCAMATMHAVSWCSSGVGGSGNSDGGGVTQTGAPGTPAASCVAWLNCDASFSPSSFAADLATYGPNGTCWSSTAAVAANCATACSSALTAARRSSTAPSACFDAGTVVSIVGDAASNFGPAAITTFTCSAATSANPANVAARIPAGTFTMSPLFGPGDATLLIYADGVAIVGAGMSGGYQAQATLTVPATSGHISPVTLMPFAFGGQPGGNTPTPPGTVTVSGDWQCP